MRELPRRVRTLVLASLSLLAAGNCSGDNGFDLRNGLIPAEEIHRGGPPRDGIPAIDHPKFVTAGGASFLDPGDRGSSQQPLFWQKRLSCMKI